MTTAKIGIPKPFIGQNCVYLIPEVLFSGQNLAGLDRFDNLVDKCEPLPVGLFDRLFAGQVDISC